jgi:hypothetical protein
MCLSGWGTPVDLAASIPTPTPKLVVDVRLICRRGDHHIASVARGFDS